MEFDVVVIGCGVVGLAVTMELAKNGINVLALERHNKFGFETSSRNSEVLHAGIYYPHGSLKADMCAMGNRAIIDWAKKNNVTHNPCGKYIIAVNEAEVSELDRLLINAHANEAVNVAKADLNILKRNEPYVKCIDALWSPETAIIDTHGLMSSFYVAATDSSATFAFNHTVTGIIQEEKGYKIIIHHADGDEIFITAKSIINAAGLDSDRIAELAGFDVDALGYRLSYCRGHYFRISPAKKYLANHLIYPVPAKNSAGLGIHVTLDLDGELRLGPDSLYLGNREQNYDVPIYLQKAFHEAASKYLLELELDDIHPDYSGIRPKLSKEGEGFKDFIIKNEAENGFPGFINLIGIESPGLTCSLMIAQKVYQLLE